MALKETIKAKAKKARLVGGIVKDSVVFNIKKKTVRKKFQKQPIDLIVVDMDGTLFSGDVSLEALKLKYPEKTGKTVLGELLYDVILESIASGKNSVESAIVWGNAFLISRNFSKKDLNKVLELIIPGLRIDLIESLKFLKQTFNTKLVLATQASLEFGELLNNYLKKEFGLEFDFVIGSKLKFDKKQSLTGLKQIVAMKTGQFQGIPVRTKAELLEMLSFRKKIPFDFKKSLLITDGYSDIDLAKRMRTILIKVKQKRTNQKISQTLKLADYIIEDNSYLGKNIEQIVSNSLTK